MKRFKKIGKKFEMPCKNCGLQIHQQFYLKQNQKNPWDILKNNIIKYQCVKCGNFTTSGFKKEIKKEIEKNWDTYVAYQKKNSQETYKTTSKKGWEDE